jgi:hypothetical protein
MNTKDIIKFEELTSNVPIMVCYACANVLTPKKMAIIKPFTDERYYISYEVCSDDCEQFFLNYPSTMRLVLEDICKISMMQELSVKEEYCYAIDLENLKNGIV